MAIISIEKMEFFAYHGCFKEEQQTGTWFNVDIRYESNTKEAQLKDDITKTVNYQEVYNLVKKEMTIPSKLIEHVAHRILKGLFTSFNEINSATVKVSKMNPSLGDKVKNVSITLDTEDYKKSFL